MFKLYRWKCSILSCFEPILVYIGIQTVTVLIEFTMYIKNIDASYISIVSSYMNILIILLFFLCFHKRIKEITKNCLSDLYEVLSAKLIIKLILFSILIRVLIILSGVVILLLDNELVNSNLFSNSEMTFSIINMVTVCLVAPIFEEILFRGLLLDNLCKYGLSYNKANLMQTLVFMFMHGSALALISSFFFGLFQGELRRRYKSIIIPILFHVFFNIFGFISMVI